MNISFDRIPQVPNTLDNITIYIIIGGIALVGIITALIILIRRKNREQ